jgi:hypothetical protein
MSAWIDYVKTYAKENNIKYKDALKAASASYKQKKETKTDDVELSTIKKIKSVKQIVELVEPVEDVIIPETKEPIKKPRAKKTNSIK